MPDPQSESPRERLYKALYEGSHRRLKKRGLSDKAAARVAGELASRTAERTKAPDFGSQEQLAGIVHSVCTSLSDGKSYYDLIGERPYLLTGRIDRLVAAAGRVRPEVPSEIAVAARRATALERMSGGLAVLFTAAALAAAGIWWALAVGVFVSAGSEWYLQTSMPSASRRVVARYHVPRWLGVAGPLTLVWAGYSWLRGAEHIVVKGSALAVFALVVIAAVPGFTLAVLVSLRERRWRASLERELMERESRDSGSEDTPDL